MRWLFLPHHKRSWSPLSVLLVYKICQEGSWGTACPRDLSPGHRTPLPPAGSVGLAREPQTMGSGCLPALLWQPLENPIDHYYFSLHLGLILITINNSQMVICTLLQTYWNIKRIKHFRKYAFSNCFFFCSWTRIFQSLSLLWFNNKNLVLNSKRAKG